MLGKSKKFPLPNGKMPSYKAERLAKTKVTSAHN